jgi:hypothetical protein
MITLLDDDRSETYATLDEAIRAAQTWYIGLAGGKLPSWNYRVESSEFCESRTSRPTPDQGWPRWTRLRQLIDFAKTDDVDPLLFYKPYYLEVSQALDKRLYALARSLTENCKILVG